MLRGSFFGMFVDCQRRCDVSSVLHIEFYLTPLKCPGFRLVHSWKV
uniref:Uncharacterized protein n=1 Tax=Arundo donax TaxID=35708 RepID=A0A0A9FTU8_ARUDO